LDLAGLSLKKEKDLKRFRENSEEFERRATAQGLNSAELAETYRQIARIMQPGADTVLRHEDRLKIAQQAMHQAAFPSRIDQGRHQSCSVTAVEVRTYTKTPSKAVQLVADIATKNSFRTADGTDITLHPGSLKADEEASQNPTPDGKRSYASQLFEIAAANIHWMRVTENADGQPIPKHSLGVAQMPEKRGITLAQTESGFGFDTGERLFDLRSTPPLVLAKDFAIKVGHVEDISNQITGLNESGFVIENAELGALRNTVHFRSTADLQQTLYKLKADGSLPALIRVHTANEPFYKADADWHLINVMDFDASNGKTVISNQWGARGDMTVKVGTLYQATLPPK
jgi:hypothetical protein